MAEFYYLHLFISILKIFQSELSFASYIEYSHSVDILDCAFLKGCYFNESSVTKSWRFNNVSIFLNKVYVHKSSSQEMELLPNGSLLLPSVSFHNEGIYSCISDSITYFLHHLHVKDRRLHFVLCGKK